MMLKSRPIQWSLVFTGVLISFLVFNYHLLNRSASPRWDADQCFTTWQMLIADFARSGRFLLWNPWVNGGSPDFIDPQVGAFSPVCVMMGWLTGGKYMGFVAYWLLIWLMGGLGLLILARHLRAPPWAGFVVALGYLFCGFYTGHAEHTSWLHAFSWLPFVLWRLDVALQQRRWRPAFEAGALWGLSALAGYPGLIMVSGGFLILWTCGRVVFGPRQPARLHSALLAVFCLAVVFTLGLLILSPVYAGFFFEGRGYSTRISDGGYPRDIAVESNALDPGALTTFASPYLQMLQKRSRRTLWPDTDPSSCSVYVGPVILLLGFFSLLVRPRDGWRWWLLFIALLSIGLALGRDLPLRGWLYDFFPPSRYFRHSSMFRGFAILCFTILSLIGSVDLSRMMRGKGPPARTRLFVAAEVLTVIAFCAYFSIFRIAGIDVEFTSLSFLHLTIAWLGICLAALLPKPGSRRRLHASVAVLCLLAVSDAAFTMILGHGTVYLRSQHHSDLWRKLDKRHTRSLDLREQGIPRTHFFEEGRYITNKNLPVKQPNLINYSPLQNHFHQRWVLIPELVRTAIGDKRTWFAEDAGELPLTIDAFDAFSNRVRRDQTMPILIHSPEALRTQPGANESIPLEEDQRAMIQSLPKAVNVPISILEYWPDSLVFEADCPDDGWLLITDRWSPGWRVLVNGRAGRIYGGNFIFRAIQVSRGMNEVRFSYHPVGYPWLLIMSWVLLGSVACGSIWQIWRSRTDRPATASVEQR